MLLLSREYERGIALVVGSALSDCFDNHVDEPEASRDDDANSDSVTHEKISLENGFWWYFSRISCVSKHLRCDMLTPFKSEEGGLSEYDSL